MSQTFNYIDAAGETKPIVADSIIDAVKLVAQLLGPAQHDMVIDIEAGEEVVTFVYTAKGNVEEVYREPKTRLVEVRVVVRVPINVDVDEYLNEVSFDCIIDDKDIYERVDGYRPLGDLES